MKIGIVGLPNVGKSTLFQALTKKEVAISNYPFSTIDPNVAVLAVPDERLFSLAAAAPQARVFPAVIEIVDVAGLVKGAHRGEGLGNKFLSELVPMQTLLLLLRLFRNEKVTSLADKPAVELEILREELSQKGLEQKPSLIVCNIRKDEEPRDSTSCQIFIDAKWELELSQLTSKEQKELGEESELPKLIKACFKTLNLITFYTLKGGKELRAWAIPEGTLSPQAGKMVHSDFEEKFIRAEVIGARHLIEAGSWSRAKAEGLIRTEGREYQVQDGDVIEFKI